MFSDVFIEQMVKKDLESKDCIIIAALGVIAIFLSIFVFVLVIGIIPQLSTIGLLLIAGIWYGYYILVTRRRVEYEYILTNSEIDIDKIMAKRTRKRVASFDFKEAELVACVKDDLHNHVIKNAENNVKILNYSGDSEHYDVYFVDINTNGERKIILFRPTSKMLEGIKRFNPRNVHIME